MESLKATRIPGASRACLKEYSGNRISRQKDMNHKLFRLFWSIIFSTMLAAAAAASERAEDNVCGLVDEVQRLHGPSLAEAIVADIDIGRTSKFVLGRYDIGHEEGQLVDYTTRSQFALLNLISRHDALTYIFV